MNEIEIEKSAIEILFTKQYLYIVFISNRFYPRCGVEDYFDSFDTKEQLIGGIKKAIKESDEFDFFFDDQAIIQVINTNTNKVLKFESLEELNEELL